MFWCLVRLSTGALCGGLYANPLEMAIQSAVACSEAKDDGLLVSRQLMERVLVWVVSFSLALEDGFLLWIRIIRMFLSIYPYICLLADHGLSVFIQVLSYSKNATGVKKKLPKKGHFANIGNEIKICSQNKCHHHLSNICENSFRMFHSNWVISDDHSFVWAVC